jgi:transmembrane sensor
VNAYSDEAATKTTLLEGSVRIAEEDATALLKPGEQAQVKEKGGIKIITDADVEQAVAWKNGYFQLIIWKRCFSS